MTKSDLVRIDPKNPKYSKNLHAFVRKNTLYDRVFLRIGSEIGEAGQWSETANLMPALYLGMEDNPYLVGARLSNIVCNGAITPTFAHPFLCQCEDVTEAFWTRYVQFGKCALDPEHRLYFEKDRWETSGDERVCRWCGQVQEKRYVRREVVDEFWVPRG